MKKMARLLKNPIHFLSLGAGLGLIPKAPGTFGTLLGIPLVYLFAPLGLNVYLGVVGFFALVGVFLCHETGRVLKQDDAPQIVWDEVVGFMIAMIAIPVTTVNLLIAFVLFRLFDIRKPGPIRWADQKFTGGFGVMLDDVLAGLFTLIIMQALIKAGFF